MSWRSAASFGCTLLLAVLPGAAVGATVSTLTLDSLSFVSFEDKEVVPISSGTIVFRFGEPREDGTVPFTIQPEDLSLPELALSSDQGALRYTLARAAVGVMQAMGDGRIIEFTAEVVASIEKDGMRGAEIKYLVPFTTEVATARNLPATVTIQVQGLRLLEEVWHVQLVGGATNKSDAIPEPGSAVYTVLSGTFDLLP